MSIKGRELWELSESKAHPETRPHYLLIGQKIPGGHALLQYSYHFLAFIRFSRSLRQGCPVLPHLFVMLHYIMLIKFSYSIWMVYNSNYTDDSGNKPKVWCDCFVGCMFPVHYHLDCYLTEREQDCLGLCFTSQLKHFHSRLRSHSPLACEWHTPSGALPLDCVPNGALIP